MSGGVLVVVSQPPPAWLFLDGVIVLSVEMKPLSEVGKCMGRRCNASQVILVQGEAGRMVLCEECLRAEAKAAGLSDGSEVQADTISELERRIERLEDWGESLKVEITQLEKMNKDLRQGLLNSKS